MVRQAKPTYTAGEKIPKTFKHQRWLHRNVPFAPVSFGNSSFYRRRARGCELPSKLEVRFAFQTDPGVKITLFLKYSGRQSTCLHTAPMPTVWALLYLATGGEYNNDNDDDSSPLQPKAPLTFEFILTPNVQQTKCENSSILPETEHIIHVIHSWL